MSSISRRKTPAQSSRNSSKDEEWEDESYENDLLKEEDEERSLADSIPSEWHRRPSSPLGSSLGSPRRRRHIVGAIVSSPPRARPSKIRKEKRISQRLIPPGDTEDITPHVISGTSNVFFFVVSYIFQIIAGILRLAKPAIVFFIAILIFTHLLAALAGRLSATIRVALQPICIFPGTSSLPVCQPLYPQSVQANFEELINVQSSAFEQILDQSVGGSTLSLEVKKSEMATKDLIILVGISDLKSRDSISESLSKFVRNAKHTSEGLQKLSSHIQFTVDSIVAVNEYALGSIEQARHREGEASALQRLNPFAMSTDIVVAAKFTEAMDHVSERVDRLLLEGEIQFKNLQDLENHLDLLAELVSREGFSISIERDEVLASLWTHLGANRGTLRRFEKDLDLLRALSHYRRRALAHVMSAVQTLQEVKSDLEVMRERVATPGLVGSAIPVEVHMKSIQSGLARLKESSVRAKERERNAMDRMLAEP